jgi:hypothetical protein
VILRLAEQSMVPVMPRQEVTMETGLVADT